jgi:hypothetical protein
MRKCRRYTGTWTRSQDREVWTGEQGEPRIECRYQGDPQQLLAHLIATHRLPLAAASVALKDMLRDG